MADSGLSAGRLCQIALVVNDIEKASKAWAAALGVQAPGWSLTDDCKMAHTLYRGKPTEARAKLAFFKCGQVDIELIEPVGGPSTWRDGLGQGGTRVHHIAFHVPDADAATDHLKRQGVSVIQSGDYPGGRYVYLDAADQLGVVLELLANRP